MKLSQQVPAAPAPKLDQRLFEPESPRPPVEPPAQGAQKPVAEPSSDVPRPRSVPKAEKAVRARTLEQARQLIPASLSIAFDLADRPSYKRSFLLTQAEDESLEDLKLELGRRLDTKVSKEQLVRLAIHVLVEDFAANGDRSHVQRRIRGK
jgi:hypothetical protein